jgi:ubiquinone/menaquinone biosynthesis C-methylase UbiE
MSRPSQICFLSRAAALYDPVVGAMGFRRLWDALADRVTASSGMRVLDACTGTGGSALALARRGCEVVGFDLAAGMLERARRGALFRLSRAFEYLESDDFGSYVAGDFRARLEAAGLAVEAPFDAGAYRIWPCRVSRR